MKRILKVSILCSFVLFVASRAFADSVMLKNGKVVQGEIVEQTPYHVLIKVGMDYQKYYLAQVQRIEKDEEFETKINYSRFPNLDPKFVRDIVLYLEINGTRKGISDQLEELVERVPPSAQQRIKDVFRIDEIIENLIPIYAKYYTHDEIQQLIEFHQTPLGKKFSTITQNLAEDVLKVTMHYFKTRMAAQ